MKYFNAGPDWVMLGVQNPDGGVMIIASIELSQAELSARSEMDLDAYFHIVGTTAVTYYELSAEMRSYVIQYGEDYADALRKLMENWRPEPARRSAIGEQPTIEASVRRHPSHIPEIGP